VIRLLASVKDESEAQLALDGGADLIDFKNPAQGALGALAPDVIASGLRRLAGRALTSATAGDWPLQPAVLIEAVQRTGETGVDYVKLGMLPGAALEACVEALAPLALRYRIVAVFFADRGVPAGALNQVSAAGFAGAMVDTFDKRGGGLRQHLSDNRLRAFVEESRNLGLLTGLSGSLDLADIAPLARMSPGLLGFRGALCHAGARASTLSLERVQRVRAKLDASSVRVQAGLASDLEYGRPARH